ncbi:MAG: FAD-dependent oxidoreductase, partial [Acidobacteriota bacterium]|nr:FAD-dependent oxidoreductase [Acidobacteriota bacterium]
MALNDANNRYDVAVIGAGVFGAWIGYHLLRAGKRIILVDAYGAGNSRSSSGGESRIIRMGYGADEVYTRSAQRSLRVWLEFSRRVSEPLFQRTGVLWLAHDDDPYPEKCAQTLERVGVPFEKLSATNLAARYPQLATDDIRWALFEPDSGALLARRAVQAVVREAIKEGATYLREMVQAPASHGRLDCVRTQSGRQILGENFVFACGPWLPQLFPALLEGRICPSRQEVFFFGAGSNASLFTPEVLPIWIDFKDEAYGFPDLESRGVKIAIDRHGPPFDPDSGDRVVSGAGLAAARGYLARRTPQLARAPVLETRVCQYENTSSGDFLIDRHPDFENVWLVGGGSGHGFKHGPTVGEYLVARINGIEEGIEPRFS